MEIFLVVLTIILFFALLIYYLELYSFYAYKHYNKQVVTKKEFKLSFIPGYLWYTIILIYYNKLPDE